MNDEVKRRVRQLVLDGKISSEEASRITEAMESDDEIETLAPVLAHPRSDQRRPSSLTVYVEENGEQLVNLKFPISMAQLAWPIASKYLKGVLPANLEFTDVADLIGNSEIGPLMDVQVEDVHIVMALE